MSKYNPAEERGGGRFLTGRVITVYPGWEGVFYADLKKPVTKKEKKI